MPPSPWRAARGSGMAPEGSREAASSEGEALPGARTRHAGDSHMLGSGKRAVGIPKVRRGQQPGSFSSSSSQENSSLWENHQHLAPPGPEGLVRGGFRGQPDDGNGRESSGSLSRHCQRGVPAGIQRGRQLQPSAGMARSQCQLLPALGLPGTAPAPAPFPLRPGSGVPQRSPAGILGGDPYHKGRSLTPWDGWESGCGRQSPGMGHPRNSQVNRNVSGSAPATCCRR